jgi:hypothetical protein
MKKYKTITYREPNFILFDLTFLAILVIGLYYYAAPEVSRVLNDVNYNLELVKRIMK